ncbi:CAP domain-containing protein [Kitasatospora sp. NPDC001539]|uniref:CAP domain-containing protein n=1 Tax=Kitasatospora sp. NPDC001539 TaxID=3154384 RepID=UPI003329445F
MNSDDRTIIIPPSGGTHGTQGTYGTDGVHGPEGTDDRPGGRAARRAAQRTGGRGRRARKRGALVPVTAVVAAVAGTGLVAALAGAGYAAYGGKQSDRDLAGQAVAADALIAAELGTHDGIQVPGAGGAVAVAGSPGAGDPSAIPSTSAAPTATASASPTAQPTPTATATAQPTATATAKPSPTAARTAANGAGTGAGSAATAQRATAGAAAAPAGGGPSASYAQQVVDLVNAERAKAGCAPVTAEPRLASAAQSHSDDMADRNYFDHASPEGYHADHRIEAAGYRWSTWGENIARGQKDPAAVMDAWMNSPGHRANILNCAFKQLGVGVRTGSGGPWWTQVFAAPA